jgi:dTDP-4-dehydrorhamnose reductase
MKILLTGASGQVGYELARSLQCVGEVIAPDRRQMDLTNLDQIRSLIREIRPALIVNPAAYTAVDQAEQEPELAMRINAEAPGVMAQEAARLGAAMIHYSTDYVFDGRKQGAYTEDDAPNPLSVYGRSKLAGEQAVQQAGIAHLILRTSWVYGMRGKNFLLTMRRLAMEREVLRIVADQHGAPTWCRTIADTTANMLVQLTIGNQSLNWQSASGLYHLTAQGQTTWFGFTQAIVAGLGDGKQPQLIPITTDAYPLPAVRPMNSVLSCERLQKRFCRLPNWQTALALSQS